MKVKAVAVVPKIPVCFTHKEGIELCWSVLSNKTKQHICV
jgi:hypothetical protein